MVLWQPARAQNKPERLESSSHGRCSQPHTVDRVLGATLDQDSLVTVKSAERTGACRRAQCLIATCEARTMCALGRSCDHVAAVLDSRGPVVPLDNV